MEEKNRSLLEAIKEVGRYIFSAIVAWLLTEGTIGLLVSLVGEHFKVEETTQLLIVAGVTAIIRAIDKYIHEQEAQKPKSEQNKGLLGLKGITGF